MQQNREERKEEFEERARLKRAELAVKAVILASIGIFAIIALLGIINEGISKFVSTLLSINPYYYLVALACVLGSITIGFPKWHLFLKRLRLNIPVRRSFIIYFSMFSMDITPGRWGRAAVAYTIKSQTNANFGRIFPAVVADIFTDFLGFIIVALGTAAFVHSYSNISIAISLILLIPFVFIFYEKPFKYLKKKFYKYKRLRGFFNIGDTYFKSKSMLNLASYAFAMIFTIPATILDGLALYFVVLSFGIKMSFAYFPTLLFIYTTSLLLGMITGVPGTLGVTDAALLSYLTAFFGKLGITFGTAALITILFRVASIWFMEAICTLALLYTMRYLRA